MSTWKKARTMARWRAAAEASESTAKKTLSQIYQYVVKTQRWNARKEKATFCAKTMKGILKGHPLAKQILELAKWCPHGWPDFCCREGDDLMFFEIKSGDSRPTDGQYAMANELGKLGVTCRVWREDGLSRANTVAQTLVTDF